ncbi:MAG: orotate phosphoribosyltransferase [Flavobacteriales bacterium]|jgi:orotate phosphoribosyltransferase|tara:strand:- start:117 stop:761 length:645 start_codon:yes stop_codon:yes gene_type:complete
MILDKDTAKKTAEFLLQIKAIKLQPSKPFTWASGWESPIYCDNRITLSHHGTRTYLREQLADAVVERFGKPDVIAGVATGAIAHGILVAQELGLPFVYVRPEPKNHGRKNQIEGYIEPGQNVVVIEDLISTGGSSLKAVKALEEIGCTVKGMAAIFTYGFKLADDNFKEAKCELVTLSDYSSLVDQAIDTGYISDEEIDALKKWREAPDKWQGL